MSHISPKEFYDEYDIYYHLKRLVRKERYIKPFLFLYDNFFVNNKTHVTTRILQERLCIPDHGEAYQLLFSLYILKLLHREGISSHTVIFKPINKDWWDITKKELDKKNGDTKTG